MAALASAIPRPLPGGGMLRVVSNRTLMDQEAAAAEQAANEQRQTEAPLLELASFIRGRMTDMRNFRNTEGIAERLLEGLRTYKGMYDPAKLQQIKQFGGSEVYARVTATKCRAATALLRDVFLSAERPWDLAPTPDPKVPVDIEGNIRNLVATEVATLAATGQEIDNQMIVDRVAMLRQSAERAAKKQAVTEAEKAGDVLDDYLIEGGFYEAFGEFLVDLPIFPYAVLKGPVVRRQSQLKWVNGKATTQYTPKMFWERVSPFDLYWSPGAGKVTHADFVERIRLTRAELVALRDLPGYRTDAIDEVLARFYDGGFHDWWDVTDTERAQLEDRERWGRTTTTLIDCAAYTGFVSGKLLLEWGMTDQQIADPLAEYFTTCWMIDRHVIKAQINPSPDQRAPYYISSFEKIPGALVGYGLPDLLEDVQQICNATARAMVNNLSIASGPQVVINDEVLQPGENDMLFPWKRWHVAYDPMVANAHEPVSFFQPTSNAAELLGVYEKWVTMADEISSIPRYMTGNEKVGGAGRTASGLAMLMGNASKTLQNIAAQIDNDILEPLLQQHYNMVMLLKPGVLNGDESIVVKGVNHAVKREQDRMRQLEFLQLTANPIDMSIIGPEGRASVLRSVSSNLGLDHETVVPDSQTLEDKMAQQAAMQQQQMLAGGDPNDPNAQPGAQPGNPQQMPKPDANRAGPEQVRKQTGMEQRQTSQVTGRPGMRAGTGR